MEWTSHFRETASASGRNHFAARIYGKLAVTQPRKNLFLSPFSIKADHLFLYFIRDRSTNAVLFSGHLLDPK